MDVETSHNAAPGTRELKESESEESLMTAYVAGDRAAFARLFQGLAPRVHAFFARSFRDTAVADDLLQTTFLKLHKARSSYRPGEPLRPWVFTIAARVRFDELRRRYRLPEDANEEALEHVPSDALAPDALVANAARDAVVRSALDRLPESQRVVIHLHRFEGLSFAEIGAMLGTSEGAVRIRAFRAYETLRGVLAPLMEEDRG